jgi:L-fuculose-phosphate aldolase
MTARDGPDGAPAEEADHAAQRADAEEAARRSIVDAMRALDRLGLNRGSTGNASLRWPRQGRPGMLITPTGADAERLGPGDLCWMGDDGALEGPWAPSSEWALHRSAYAARDGRAAVLHTHAEHATALACLGRPMPAFHYMVAVAGGADVPLVPYHTFGTQALADAVGRAMVDRDACLLAQHGLLTAGSTLAQALKVMREIESLCKTYLLALAVGQPPILDAAEMARVVEKFRHYGKSRRAGRQRRRGTPPRQNCR